MGCLLLLWGEDLRLEVEMALSELLGGEMA